MENNGKQVRIASYYPDKNSVGRNDGGPLFHTYNLRKLFGQENVVHLLPKGDLSRYGTFDLNYWVDFGDDAVGLTDFVCPRPNVYIPSDTHLGYKYRLKKAREFDWVFCNCRNAVDDFIRDGIPADRVFWLPHGFDPLAYSKGVFNEAKNEWDENAEPIKKYDVCFVGHLNDQNRVDHLDRLFKEIPNFYWGNQRFHQAAEKFNQSKIVFNVSAARELNMRHFESLGAGAFLLTDNIPPENNVFKEGVHFVGYDSHDDMIDKARYYLDPAHEAEREKIAAAGHLEAISHHTYLHRVLKVLDTVGVKYDRELAKSLLPKIPELQPA